MPPTTEAIAEMVRRSIPDAEVNVQLFSGNNHFEMEVVSTAFAGKSRIVQHQMVYTALGDNMRQAIHALALKTAVPAES
jgi:stress-induced morphogen